MEVIAVDRMWSWKTVMHNSSALPPFLSYYALVRGGTAGFQAED